jgi:hypothetical protein
MATAKKALTDPRVQGRPARHGNGYSANATTSGSSNHRVRDQLASQPTPNSSSDSDETLWDAGKALARKSRWEQGLPETIEDPATIARIVALLRSGLHEPE